MCGRVESTVGSPRNCHVGAIRVNWSYNRDTGKLNMTKTWNICQGNLALQRANLRQRHMGCNGQGHRERGLPRPFGVNILPQYTPGARHGATVLNVCSAEFWAGFDSISLSTSTFLPFGIRTFTPCHYMFKVYTLHFNYYRGSWLRLCLEFRRNFWT